MSSSLLFGNQQPALLTQRVPFTVEVSCISDVPQGTRQYLAMNMGKGGLFLKTLLPLEVGSLLRCSFRIPDGNPPVIANAKVVWNRRGSAARHDPAGMGIRFINLSPEDRERISHHVGGYELTGE